MTQQLTPRAHTARSSHWLIAGLGLVSLLAACQSAPLAGASANEKKVAADPFSEFTLRGQRALQLTRVDGQAVGNVAVQIGLQTYQANGGYLIVPASVAEQAKLQSKGFVILFARGFVPRQVWLGQTTDDVAMAPLYSLATEPFVPMAGGRVASEDGAIAVSIGAGLLTKNPTSIAISSYSPPLTATAASGADPAKAREDFLASVLGKPAYRLAAVAAPGATAGVAACSAAEQPLPCSPATQALGLAVTVNGTLAAGTLTTTYNLDKLSSADPNSAAAAQRILRTFQQIDADPNAASYRAKFQSTYGLTLSGHTLSFVVPITNNDAATGFATTSVAGCDLLGVKLEVTVTSSVGPALPTAALVPGQLDGVLAPASGTSLAPAISSAPVANTGLALLGKGKLLSQDGGGLISQDGGGLFGVESAGLLSQDGGGLLSQDGGGLISQDGGTLLSQDGGGLISQDGGTLLSQDGGGLRSNAGGSISGVLSGVAGAGSSLVSGPDAAKYGLLAFTAAPIPGASVSASSNPATGALIGLKTDGTGAFHFSGLPDSGPVIALEAQDGAARYATFAPAPRGCAVKADIDPATTLMTLQVLVDLGLHSSHTLADLDLVNFNKDADAVRLALTPANVTKLLKNPLPAIFNPSSGACKLLSSPLPYSYWKPAPAAAMTNSGAVEAPFAGTAGSAGSADGPVATASFTNPKGLFFDWANQRMAVGDTYGNSLRLINFATTPATVTTLATGISHPKGVCIANGKVYVAREGDNQIGMKDLGTGLFATIAGASAGGYVDGAGASARFNTPRGVAVAPDGSVYVADCGNDRIRKLTLAGSTWTVTTVAGGTSGFADGSGAAARFSSPSVLVYDPQLNALLCSDMGNQRIRKLDLALAPTDPKFVSTFAGSGASYLPGAPATASGGGIDGTLLGAKFLGPYGLSVDPKGIVYVTEWTGGIVRRLDPVADQVTTLRTTGFGTTGPARTYGNPAGVTSDATGARLFFEEFQQHDIHLTSSGAGAAPGAGAVMGAGPVACP